MTYLSQVDQSSVMHTGEFQFVKAIEDEIDQDQCMYNHLLSNHVGCCTLQ
jgi:hypothetical protein